MFRSCSSLILPSISRASAVRSFRGTPVRLENTRPEQKEVDRLFTADAQSKRRHALSINRVELVGGVADTPVARVSRNGNEYITFGLFTNVDFKKADGSMGEHVELHNVHAFGGQANFIKNNVARGSRVFVVGRLHYEGGQVRPDGSRSARVASVTADNVIALSRRQSSADPQSKNE
ncbi:hypothetical protein FO519_003380 [Halicephalobus sp. NKZ332]|nr:hypothetical protein FO519_003380 [Halicephalobus sp. NKZ332]